MVNPRESRIKSGCQLQLIALPPHAPRFIGLMQPELFIYAKSSIAVPKEARRPSRQHEVTGSALNLEDHSLRAQSAPNRSNRLLCARFLCTCGYLIDYRHRFLEAGASLRSICLYGFNPLFRVGREVYYMT